MKTEIIKQDDNSITIKVDINNKNKNFLKTEEDIMKEVNKIGNILTKKSLEKLDEKEAVIEKDGKKSDLKKIQKKL